MQKSCKEGEKCSWCSIGKSNYRYKTKQKNHKTLLGIIHKNVIPCLRYLEGWNLPGSSARTGRIGFAHPKVPFY